MPISNKGRYRIEILKNQDSLQNPPKPAPTNHYRNGGGRRTSGQDDVYYGSVKLVDPRAKGQNAKNYICVDSQEAFQVKIISTNMNDAETYGAVLFLDGQRIHGKKTFRRVTTFPGYKKGGGCYSEFLFTVPDLGDERQLSNRHDQQQQGSNRLGSGNMSGPETELEQKHNGKHGTIIIEFFRTEEFERRMTMPNRVHGKKYAEQPVVSDMTKKNFSDSLCIKKGKDFQISTNNNQQTPPPQHQSQSNNQDSNQQQQSNYYRGNSNGGGHQQHHNNDYAGAGDQSAAASSQQYGRGGGANGGNNFRKRDQKFQDKRNNNYQNQNQQNGGGGFGNNQHHNNHHHHNQQHNNNGGGPQQHNNHHHSGTNGNSSSSYQQNNHESGTGGGRYGGLGGGGTANNDQARNVAGAGPLQSIGSNNGWHRGGVGNHGNHNSASSGGNGNAGGGNSGGEMTIDYKVLYDTVIDTCEIHYSNWAYLQCNKLVDVKMYEHLRLTPQSLMNSPDFVTKVLWTVIKYNHKLHHSKCDDEFYKATGHRISDFFEFKEGDLIIFLKKRVNMFIVDDKGWSQAKDYDERKEFNLNQSSVQQRKTIPLSGSGASSNQQQQVIQSTASNASKDNTPLGSMHSNKPNVVVQTPPSNREIPVPANGNGPTNTNNQIQPPPIMSEVIELL